MKLTTREIARMIDLSLVRTEHTEDDVRKLAAAAKKHQCICALVLPCHVPLLRRLLAGQKQVHLASVVGFPSGAVSSTIKAAEAAELAGIGCDELDMVINVAMLRSGRHRYVQDDIRGVVQAAAPARVKVILECHYLTDDEIRRACELSMKAGAAFVKTGTGWAPTGATVENVALIKSCVGQAIGIKAAGGIRSLDTLIEMYRRGARRFGLGLESGLKILQQAKNGHAQDR